MKVTIAIPTIGRLKFLEQSLQSALRQTYPHIEILVGDNSGDRGIRARVSGIVGKNSAIRIVSQSEKLSMATHWNALASEATGDFFVLLADDDLLEAEFVERLLQLQRDTPEAGVLFSDHWIIDGSDRIDVEASESYSIQNQRNRLSRGLLTDSASVVWSSSVPICSSMISTELVRRFGFNANLNTPELEFFARLAERSVSFSYLPERLARYRLHPDSETSSIGLRYDRLFDALVGIAAPPGSEHVKRALLSDLLVTATTTALQYRDLDRARAYVDHSFYPRSFRKRPVILLQRFCSALPRPLALALFDPLYCALRKLKPVVEKGFTVG